jgi:hypothetical protein
MLVKPAGRRMRRRRDAILVSAVALLGATAVVPVHSADPVTATDQLQTMTPIKQSSS